MRVAPLTPATSGAWAALFEACGAACFCRYWHFEGTKNEWLARCFGEPERNRDEQLALVAEGASEARGLLALEEDVAIGWMKLAPRAALARLTRQGAYRRLELGSAEGVWSVGCLLVHPAHRRRGVAGALVRAADEAVRGWGGRAIEAYPYRPGHEVHDEVAMMGPESVFVAAGFREVHGDGPYPVMRKEL